MHIVLFCDLLEYSFLPITSTDIPMHFIFRRMDIQSDIKRPANQQCSIVGIPKGPDGSPDWETYFEPSCPRDVSPQLYN